MVSRTPGENYFWTENKKRTLVQAPEQGSHKKQHGEEATARFTECPHKPTFQ